MGFKRSVRRLLSSEFTVLRTLKQSRKTGKSKRYPGVQVQDLLILLVSEEKTTGVVVNHLEVGAGVGAGHLGRPVVVAEEEAELETLKTRFNV